VWNKKENELIWTDEVFRILGYEPQAFDPSDALYSSHIHPEDSDAFKSWRKKRIESGIPLNFEHRIVRPSGEIRHAILRVAVRGESNGEYNQIIGTISDLTD
jgi:PAS domain-containing protein